MGAVKSILSVFHRESPAAAEKPLAYSPLEFYPIHPEEMTPQVIRALEDARRRNVDIVSDYITDAKERESIHAVMREHGLIRKEFEAKYANFPSVEQMLAQDPEPFQYNFRYGGRLWFIMLERLPTVKPYDPAKRYRIDSIEMPREVVAEIDKSGDRLAKAAMAQSGDCEDWGITIPTLPGERERIHSAMRVHGLVTEEYQRFNPNIPELTWIIGQSNEPFEYNFDGRRLWFMCINPIKEEKPAAKRPPT